MSKLIRKGLNTTEYILKAPVRMVKQSIKDPKNNIKETANIIEDLIGVPFKMAYGFMDRAEGQDKAKEEGEGGPTFKNIFVNPEVSVVSDEAFGKEPSFRKAKIHVTGLLCDA